MAPSVLVVHMSRSERRGLRMLAEQRKTSEEWVIRCLLRKGLPDDWDYFDNETETRRDIWERVKAYAPDVVAKRGCVTGTDLMRDIGMTRPTANKYIDRLITHFGWTAEPARRPSRGKVAGPKV